MFRSQPVPMVQGGNQLSVVKLAICYMYKNTRVYIDGGISGTTQALRLKIYGIDKTGNGNLIAICPLETKTGYSGYQYAASVITGIPVEHYNSIYFTYDQKEVNKLSPDFIRIIKQPIMFVDVVVLPDILDVNRYTNVEGV